MNGVEPGVAAWRVTDTGSAVTCFSVCGQVGMNEPCMEENLSTIFRDEGKGRLQNLPTKEWTENDLDMLLSKSFELKSLYHYNSHLTNTNQ